MKKILLAATIIFFSNTIVNAQNNGFHIESSVVKNDDVQSEFLSAPSDGHLEQVHISKNTPCISEAERQIMWNRIQNNVKILRKENPNLGRGGGGHPLFNWPTQAKSTFNDYGYYTVNFLVDHDSGFNNQIEDYNCGERTYDWATGNHSGTDIILWPYPWRRMDDQVMEIVAAAPGVIVSKVDGNFDRNCSNNGAGIWNDIHIMHEDGSLAQYLHFKSGSLTNKSLGDSVLAGDFLGTAGSSGSSNWPHLHFEVLDSMGNLIDPYDGSCNGLNPGDSWWATQENYNVPSINRLATKKTTRHYYNCPQPEVTYEDDIFNIGDSVVLHVYFRDIVNGSSMQHEVFNPNMVSTSTFGWTVPWVTSATANAFWFFKVGPNWPVGWWTWEIVYEGITYQTQFFVTGNPAGTNEINDQVSLNVFPNPANDKINAKDESINGETEVVIYDVAGREVASHTFIVHKGELSVDINQLTEGSYLMQVVNRDQLYRARFVKDF